MILHHTKNQKFPKAAIEYKDAFDKENVEKKIFFKTFVYFY